MTAWHHRAQAHPLVDAIPAFSDNYIWLIRAPGTRSVAVVDPGDAGPVEALLDREGLELSAIVLTHHHPDHTGGVERLRARGPVVLGPRDEDIEGVDRRLAGGDTAQLDSMGLSLRVIDVPGHTRGHIAYFLERLGDDPRPLLFCGDTLFAGGCGRLFEGTPAQMLASLDRLAALPAQTLVFCAHEYTLSNLRFAAAVEPATGAVTERLTEVERMRAQGLATVPSSLATELATNPFMRSRLPSVRAAAAARLGHEPASEAECFGAIRDWKNVFR
ncbi:hydroxyacylglutathione hydrolase [Quisquiliibacterium transsilvanicum]|uniref:Hydroxyacylglutathione hydrolase n=1 Tax=Quisquiliibacterium transsilvanicum TaxID=1549638 RepID=A0A7W8M7Z7_9BURK|nr:hydroxyacylglutathione hydrolase [Quisquiliibacterium transsilvanicum]MBB5271107.1 hydroxyacylglutathione hydrolase [Quisquiliibacterium transsilvanicum]